MEVFIKEEEELTGLQDVAVAKYEHYEERRNEKLGCKTREKYDCGVLEGSTNW